MNTPDLRNPVVWLIGTLGLALAMSLMRGRLSPEARVRRRREKSHRPVVSTKRGPTVKLAVKVDQPKDNQKN